MADQPRARRVYLPGFAFDFDGLIDEAMGIVARHPELDPFFGRLGQLNQATLDRMDALEAELLARNTACDELAAAVEKMRDDYQKWAHERIRASGEGLVNQALSNVAARLDAILTGYRRGDR